MNSYTSFNKCIVRIPLFPFDSLQNSDIEGILSSPEFREAILIASPVLYEDVFVKRNLSIKAIESLLKYFSRSCTRCTPYGIFAGCNIIDLNEEKQSLIVPEEPTRFKTYTRVDMNLLCDIISQLENNEQIREKLSYHINSSLYESWKTARYLEFKKQNNKRHYIFSEIKMSSYLRRLLKSMGDKDLSYQELIDAIIRREAVSCSDAKEYIDLLIRNQILVSNLEPSVVGEDLLYQIQSVFYNIGIDIPLLNDLQTMLDDIDRKNIGQREKAILALYHALDNINIATTDNKIHVDCLTEIKEGHIGRNIAKSIEECVSFLSRFIGRGNARDLEQFKTRFYELYEEQEIPLAIALDHQIGVGFGEWVEDNGDINPFIEGLPYNNSNRSTMDTGRDSVSQVIIKLYEESLKKHSSVITITEKDFEFLNEASNAPSHLCAMVSVISESDDPLICLSGIQSGPMAKLISRFEYLNKDIQTFVNKLNKSEQESFNDAIVAEIVHLPEDRIGNIQMHPQNRDYHICYFSNPHKECLANPICISDIMVSVPSGKRIVLRSKKYNKQIIPFLTTAHNFRWGLPIYRFLSELQYEYTCYYSSWWDELLTDREYRPRIQYKNIILAPQQWVISSKGLQEIIDINNKTKYHEYSHLLRNNYQLPSKFLICYGDNKLYIDMNEDKYLSILFGTLKKYGTLRIEEFLFPDNKDNYLVKRGESVFANEIIMCFKKE